MWHRGYVAMFTLPRPNDFRYQREWRNLEITQRDVSLPSESLRADENMQEFGKRAPLKVEDMVPVALNQALGYGFYGK